MNFVLRTAHAEEKKKGGHTNPDIRTIISGMKITAGHRPKSDHIATLAVQFSTVRLLWPIEHSVDLRMRV